MSAHDIPQGAWWRNELFAELGKATFAVVCLTPENLAAPWLHFEAGVIARELFQKNTSAVCTYLLGLSHAEVKGPLAAFQHTVASEEDTRKLVSDINRLQDKPLKEAVLATAFNDAWPRLRDVIARVGKQGPSESLATAKRDPNEMIAEVLERVREIGSRLPPPRPRRYQEHLYTSPKYRISVGPDGTLWLDDTSTPPKAVRKNRQTKIEEFARALLAENEPAVQEYRKPPTDEPPVEEPPFDTEEPPNG